MSSILSESEADTELLRLLVASDGSISSSELSRHLRIPTGSIERGRRRLERAYVTKQYSLDPTKFGWHRIDLLISTRGGQRTSLVKILLKRKEVTNVATMIGERTIDLRVEVVVKDYRALLNIIEVMKAINGIRDVVWTEVVQSIGWKSPSNFVTF